MIDLYFFKIKKIWEIMGFTEEEVRDLILNVDETLEENKVDSIVKEMKKNYNGYLFSVDSEKTVFNSDMVLYYLKYYENFRKEPKELIDKNIASDYAKLGNMFTLKNKDRNMEVLEEVLNSEEIEYELNTSEIRKAMKTIAQKGDNNKLINIVERTLNKLSKRDYIQFNEKYVKLIFLTYCFLSKLYLVKSEYEVENGFIDIALLKQINVNPTFFAIFELKYIKKKDYEEYGEKIVEEKLTEAKLQLKQYETAEELNSIKNLKKWAIVFAGEKCVANEEI